MRKLFVGFLLITPHADPLKHSTFIENDDATILFFTVNSNAMAVRYARILYMMGVDSIELCPNFDSEGVTLIEDAVDRRIPVGIVHFVPFSKY